MQGLNKEWQVEVQGVVYEADLDELKQWIAESAVVPSDRVRRSGLRWLPVEKVPDLKDLVLSFESGEVPLDTDMSDALTPEFELDLGQIDGLPEAIANEKGDPSFCLYHPEADSVFVCDICENYFCKTCPNSFGSTVKLCPVCNSLCRSINELAKKGRSLGSINKPYTPIEEPARVAGFVQKGASFLLSPFIFSRDKLRVLFGAKQSRVDEYQ